jgi:hypothetical protein
MQGISSLAFVSDILRCRLDQPSVLADHAPRLASLIRILGKRIAKQNHPTIRPRMPVPVCFEKGFIQFSRTVREVGQSRYAG